MPRMYKCRKCGIAHNPPTGKHCRQHRADEEPADEPEPDVMTLLLEMRARMDRMEDNMATSNDRDDRQLVQPDDDSEENVPVVPQVDLLDIPEEAEATPTSLRKDISLMAEAANRIAQLNVDDYDDDDDERYFNRRRRNGKKSGSQMMASDSVQKTIDWPHLHVRRLVAGKRKSVAYADLRSEEFVVGFLAMIGSARCKWNYRTMTGILEMIMQDTIDFSWANARSFYEMLGLAVEDGDLTWDDKETIRDARLTYSRTVFPDKKEATETPAATPKAKPALTKCCALFQRGGCTHNRDHPPFLHACAYCYKTVAGTYRHMESECARKNTDEAKNGQRRE